MALLLGTSWQTAVPASAQTSGLTLSCSELITLHSLTQYKGEVGRVEPDSRKGARDPHIHKATDSNIYKRPPC